MRELTYISDSGMIVHFGRTMPYILQYADLNSAGAVFDEVQPVGSDGSFTGGGVYLKKMISIEGKIIAKSVSELERLRAALSMAMNIRREGTLIVTQENGNQKKIRCRPNNAPSYPIIFGLSQPFTCDLQCDSPYWLDYEQTIVPIGQIIPLWQFPFTPPVTFGYAVANVDIINNTSIDIPLKIEILSQSTLIEIKNISTGEGLEISAEITEGHKMIIDGNICEITIINMFDGSITNATNRLVAGSRFITLAPGENKIELKNGIAETIPLSYIIYNNHNLAV